MSGMKKILECDKEKMRKRKSVLKAKTDTTIPSKKNIFILLTIAVFLVSAVGSASAIDIDSCGVTAGVSGGYYELTGNLTCDADETCIIIGANGVTIDGKGHKITGNRSTSDCFISIVPFETTSQTIPAKHSAIVNEYYYENVTIKDLEIKEFCSGIALKGGGVNNNTVTGCSIHDCGVSTGVTHGIHMVHTNNCTICQNEIYNIEGSGHSGGCSGGGNGIFMFGEVTTERGWYNTLTCNYLHNNDKSGFFMKHQCMYNTISHNNATCNAEGGIVPMCSMSDHNHYEYNNMSGNTIWGFMSAGNHNTIRWNTANNNQIGIFLGSAGMGPGDWNNITNNTACGNSDMDIKANDIANNAAGSNTCNTSNLGGCDWSCGANNAYLVPVYYDFDKDEDCSAEPADCSCNNILGVGSCCNPGLFNSSGAYNHCAACRCCNTSVGNDLNDADGIPSGDPVPPIPELSTIVLLGIGLLTLVGYVRLRREKD